MPLFRLGEHKEKTLRHFVLFLIAAIAPSALHAASYTFSSCTLGTTTITTNQPGSGENPSCSLVLINNNNVQVGLVLAYAEVYNLISATQANLQVTTGAGAYGIPNSISDSAYAQSSEQLSFATSGPRRLGVISFDVSVFYGGNLNENVLLADPMHNYSFGDFDGPVPPVSCSNESCEYIGELPIDLGSAFQISLTGNVAWEGGGGTEGDAQISFSLLEANGTTTVPFFATPEPSTGRLWLFGGLSLVGFAVVSKALVKLGIRAPAKTSAAYSPRSARLPRLTD